MKRRRFFKVCSRLDTSAVMKQIDAHPELWGQNGFRTNYAGSAFAGSPDIWVRYRDPSELKEAADYLAPHTPVFYPAWEVLTELWPLVFILKEIVGAKELGGILITKKPPGAIIPEHSDRGSWHAEYMDAKVWLTLRGPDEGCVHRCMRDSQVFKQGEGWTFNNLLPHSVQNMSDQEQITLIVAMRSPTGNFMKMKRK